MDHTERIRGAIVQEILPHIGPSTTLWVAYSGGLDSTVLLHALAQGGLPCPVKAIHVNHQLSPNADVWALHCADTAQAWGVALHSERVRVERGGVGLESAAREARYAVFDALLHPGDLLLTAHHRGDQVETFFYRLFRGTGMRGAGGMARARRLGAGTLLRPLLDLAREELLAYAQQHELRWVEDESNLNTAFDRNFIRRDILPLVAGRWPQVEAKVAEYQAHLTEAIQLLEAYAEEDLAGCQRRPERWGESLVLATFGRYPLSRQKMLLRLWCEDLGLGCPPASRQRQLPRLLEAREDAQPVLAWGDAELRRFDGRLYLMPALPRFSPYQHSWDGVLPLNLGSAGSLVTVDGHSRTLSLQVSSRGGGERCKPFGRGHSQTLKRLLQEYRLEPWLRDAVPLVWRDGELVAVADVFSCAADLPELKWRLGEG